MSIVAHAPKCRRGRPPAEDIPAFDEAVLAAARSLVDLGQSPNKTAIARELGTYQKRVRWAVERMDAQGRWPYPDYHKPAGCGRLTLEELIELFPDAPDGRFALVIKRGGRA